MAESIDITTADDFTSITGVDMTEYFATFTVFIDLGYNKVVDYYSGKTVTPDRQSFKLLDLLNDQTDLISQKINIYKESFTNYRFWILIEKFEEIKQKLDTITNISRYLRSSILPNSYKLSPLIDYTVKQGETLQSVSRNVLSSNNSLNDWAQIAIDNDLEEESYTPEGGYNIQVIHTNNSSIFVNSVVDNLNLDNVYGKDFCKKLQFITLDDGTQDLSVLTPSQTIRQACEILANLKKGNNPAFPEDGIDKSFVIGRNISSIAYPSILRQLQQVFQKDDTISSINITDLNQREDLVEIEMQIKTILEELLPKFSIKI